MAGTDEIRFNDEDQVREAIAADLPGDRQSVLEQRSVFHVTTLLGWMILAGGAAAGLWVTFYLGYRALGILAALGAVLLGAAAISVGRDGSSVCEERLGQPREGTGAGA